MKGLEVGTASFVAQLQSAKVSEPTECAFDDVPGLSQAAAVSLIFAQRFQKRSNAQPFDLARQFHVAVGRVALQYFGLATRPSARPLNGRQGREQRQRHATVMRVRRRGFNDQGHARGFRQNVAFAALFRAIRRVRAGVRPPKTARTLALSKTARSRLIAPDFPSAVSSSAWSFDQTADRVHAANRRQQVLPLPHPISMGRSCQGIPVLRTNTIPVSAARCSTGGRPPLGEGGGNGGNNGSISFHNSSDTSSAMRMPPCFTRRRNSTHSIQVLK